MKFIVAASLVAAASAAQLGFHSDAVVDAILNEDDSKLAQVEVPAVGFHFRVPLDENDGFDDLTLSLIDLTDPAAAKGDEAKKKKKKDDNPVQCETICKPMADEEAAEALVNSAAAKAENAATETTAPRAPVVEDEDAGNEEEIDTAASLLQKGSREGYISLAELGRTICHVKGGKWDHRSGECAPFMRSTTRKVQNDGKNLFNACKEELGTGYVPCSPYQALALAHMYDVPDHMYFWLWPGGRHDQVEKAAMKQDIGNNPVKGMDTCPEEQAVGFFHNWNEAHVDSWGCLHTSQSIPVLCCRQN